MPTVLILDAEPTGRTRTQAKHEVRAIKDALRDQLHSSAFDCEHRPGARAEDISPELLRHRPAIFHFIGHGDEAGHLLFEDRDGGPFPVDQADLAELFRAYSESVRCVVLSACYSADQAALIAEHVDVVIGVPATVEPEAITRFSAIFYAALASGESIAHAFELAVADTKVLRLESDRDPVLHVRPGVNASRLYPHDEGLPPAVVARDLVASSNTAIEAQTEQAQAADAVGAHEIALDDLRLAYEQAARLHDAAPTEESSQTLALTESRYGSALIEHGMRRQGIARLVGVAQRALSLEFSLDAKFAEPLCLKLAQLGHTPLARQLLEAAEVESAPLELLFDITESKLPETLPDAVFLRTQIGFALERRGEFDEVAKLVPTILASEDVTAVDRVNACLLLGRAIHATALRTAHARTVIAEGERFTAIERFTQLVTELREACASAKRGVRQPLEEIALAVEGCTLDGHGQARSLEQNDQFDGPLLFDTPADATDEPWRAAHDLLLQLIDEQRIDEARQRAHELIARYPHIHLFYVHAAEFAADEDAIALARQAYALVPGVGQARTLALSLLRVEHYRDARELLEPFLARPAHADDPRLLRVAAWSVRRSDPEYAARLFEHHLQLEPSPDPSDLVCYMEVLQSLSRWQAYEAVVDRALGLELEPSLLTAIANSLTALDDHSQATEARLRSIYERLGEHAKDPNVEASRMSIYLGLRAPSELARPNYSSLIEAGYAKALSLDQMSAHLGQLRQRQNTAWTAWRKGGLSFTMFQRATGLEAAQLLHRMITRRAGDEPLLLPPFVTPRIEPVDLDPAGRHILLGELEIALLLELGVWDRLLEALGDDGRLLVFEQVWETSIRDSATRLRHRAAPIARDRERALLAKLRQWSKVRPEARDANAIVVAIEGAPEGDEVASVYDLIEVLVRERWLARDQIDDHWPEGQRRWDSTPPRLSLDYTALEILDEANILAELVEYRAIEEIVVEYRTFDLIQRRIDELDEPFGASRRAEAIKQAVLAAREAGRLELVDQPLAAVDAALPPATGKHAEVLRAAMVSIMSWRWCLADDPQAMLLSADHVIAAGSLRVDVGINEVLAWESEQQIYDFISSLPSSEGLVESFAQVVEWLAPDERKFDIVDRLGQLGLPGALYPHHLLALATRYAGLSGQHTQRMFDQHEWLSHAGLDKVGSTQSFVSMTYAGAVWQAWCSEQGRQFSDEVREDLCAELCRRVAALAREEFGVFTRLFFDWLLVFVSSGKNWIYSTVSAAGQPLDERSLEGPAQTILVDDRSHASRLWAWLKPWIEQSDDRRRAWNMGVQAVALQLMDSNERRQGPLAEILYLAVEAVSPMDLSALGRTPMRYLAIVASLAETEPTLLDTKSLAFTWPDGRRELSCNEMLTELAKLDTYPEQQTPPWLATGELELGDRRFSISAPPELVLLRSPSEHRSDRLAAWAASIAPYDGQLAAAALACARSDCDAQAVQAFLVAALRSPWHTRDDSVLGPIIWGAVANIHYPGSLADLQALLVEDIVNYDPLDFNAKSSEGGPYHGLDSQAFIQQILSLPGPTPLIGIARRTTKDREIPVAWKQLDAARHALSVELSTAIVILMRHVSTCNEDREQHAARLAQLLAKALTDEFAVESDASTPSTAVLERLLLGHCKNTVARFARDTRKSLPPERLVWLSWRLFQWWWARLLATDPASRHAGLTYLLSMPAPHNLSRASAGIVLDPDRFDPTEGWNHRLASALMAMTFGQGLGASSADGRALTFSDPSLESALFELATRPLTAAELQLRAVEEAFSPFEWYGAVAVPDLALEALLHLMPQALARVPESTRARWYREYLVDDPTIPSPSWLVRDALRRAVAVNDLESELEGLELVEIRPPPGVAT